MASLVYFFVLLLLVNAVSAGASQKDGTEKTTMTPEEHAKELKLQNENFKKLMTLMRKQAEEANRAQDEMNLAYSDTYYKSSADHK